MPNPVFSNTNVLKLKFKQAEQSYGLLYDITYIASDKGRGCGGEVFNYAGVFTSPGYPNTDRNDSDCTWVINVPQTLKVALSFDGKIPKGVFLQLQPFFTFVDFSIAVFDMGSRRMCDNNFLEIIEPNSEQAPRKFCGPDKIAQYKSKTNTLSIRFKSGRDFAGTGWVLTFMAVHEQSTLESQ